MRATTILAEAFASYCCAVVVLPHEGWVTIGGWLITLAAVHTYRRRRHHPRQDLTVATWLERHAFPSDTVEDVLQGEAKVTSLAEARRHIEEYRRGREEAEWEAHERRSEAARRAARTRKGCR